MGIQVKYLEDVALYYDSKNYWQKIGDKMFGYCQLSEMILEHTARPISDFVFLSKEPKVKPPVEYLSEDQRAKPVGIGLVPNPAYEALMGGS